MIFVEITISLIFIFTLYFLFYLHRVNRKNKLYIHELEQRNDEISLKIKNIENKEIKLETKLDSKQTELIDFALNIVQKNNFLEDLKLTVNEIKNFSKDTKTIQKLNILSLNINQHIAIDRNRKSFQLQLEQANQEFYNRLLEKYPSLTVKEKRLASYLRLKLNSKEIASLLNITEKSVEMNRYRLRKKLSVGASDNLVEFILKI